MALTRVTSELIDRLVFGPDAPVGKPYTPRPRWRCALGLHRLTQVWEMTRISETSEGGRHEAHLAVRLDREPDYETCVWCGRIW